MNGYVNYFEKAKSLFLQMVQQNTRDRDNGLITEEEYDDNLQALTIVSEVVGAQYSQDVVQRKGMKILHSQQYFEQVKDQVDIYLNYIIDSLVIGIKKENIPSELSLQIVAKNLKALA